MTVRRAVVALAALFVFGASACGNDSLGTVGLYDRAPVPFVPDRTEALPLAPEAALADGYYWAELLAPTGAADVLSFELTQVVFAATCEAQFGADACAEGFVVVADHARTIATPLADLTVVSVAAATRQNFAVTALELQHLAAGDPPSAGAPDGYEYTPYQFLVTVSAGVVTEAHQIWTA